MVFNFKKNKAVGGQIGYFGLSDWWLSEFSESERGYIVKKIREYEPLTVGDSTVSLTEGEILSSGGSAVSMLFGLAMCFNNERDRTIAYKSLKRAEELIDEETDILDVHYFLHSKIKVYYRQRDIDTDALDNAIKACEEQIELAPQVAVAFQRKYKNSELPGHTGYEQLMIIKDKAKDFESVLNLVAKAKEQGWHGEWEKRIERCKQKLAKD